MSSFWRRLILAGSEIYRALVVLVGSPKLVGSRVWHLRFRRLGHAESPFYRYEVRSVTDASVAVFASALPKIQIATRSMSLSVLHGCNSAAR
jgi:hypothetical protein